MRRLLLILAAAALVAPGCGGGEGAPDAPQRVVVVAGFYPLAWAAAEIGGGDVEVVNLTPPGAEAHDLELSARDVARVRGADVVLYVGSSFQPPLEEAAADHPRAIDVLDRLALRWPEEHDDDHTDHGHTDGHEDDGDAEEHDHAGDPHVWLDPQLFAQVARRIGAELARPEAGEELARRLEALDRELEQGLESCVRREIVTSHAAFGYLADRYGLVQVAISGIAPEAEPNPRALARVVERVRETGATTIFHEPLGSPRVAEAVAREAGVSVAELNPLEGLTREELERDEDYVSVMRRNLAALRGALECE